MTSKRPIKIHVGRPSPLTSGARHPRGWTGIYALSLAHFVVRALMLEAA